MTWTYISITNVLVNTMTNTYHTFPPSIMFLVTNPAKFSETVSCNTYAQVYGMSHPHWLIHMLSHSQTDTLHTAAWSVRWRSADDGYQVCWIQMSSLLFFQPSPPCSSHNTAHTAHTHIHTHTHMQSTALLTFLILYYNIPVAMYCITKTCLSFCV